MSSISKAFYAQFAPVLNESGWYETGAAGYGSVFFRNVIHQESDVEITVGIVVSPSSWRYCADYTTPGFRGDIKVKPLPVETPWSKVRDYYLKHGLATYDIYLKDLDARIEADFAKGRIQQ